MNAATIEFRAKVQALHYSGEPAPRYQYVRVPKIRRTHCDMPALRVHRRIGGIANSTLFDAAIARELRDMGIGDTLRLDALPAGVTVDSSGFLAAVRIELAP